MGETTISTSVGPVAINPEENAKPAHGWKTYVAGFGAIVDGAVEALVKGNYSGGIKMVIGGVALIGLRGAAAKVISALRSVGLLKD